VRVEEVERRIRVYHRLIHRRHPAAHPFAERDRDLLHGSRVNAADMKRHQLQPLVDHEDRHGIHIRQVAQRVGEGTPWISTVRAA
jgi:hypothetical protein